MPVITEHDQIDDTFPRTFYSSFTKLATRSFGNLLLTIIPVVTSLAFVVGSIYWFKNSIIRAYYTSIEFIFATVGLGIVPIGLLGLVFGCVLIKRPKLLLKIHIWVGLIGLLIFSLGIFAYFQPYQGLLSLFTLNGEVSLGGDWGNFIMGSGGLASVMRLLGLALLAVVILRPSTVLHILTVSKALGSYIYISVLAIFGYLLTMYIMNRDVRESDTNMPKTNYKGVSGNLEKDRFDEKQETQELRLIAEHESGTPSQNYMIDHAKYNEDMEHAHDKESNFSIERHSIADIVPGQRVPLVKKFNSLWNRTETQRVNLPDPENPYKQTETIHGISPSSANWDTPSSELLLEVPEGGITNEEMERTSEVIRGTFSEYGVEVKVGQIRPGPAVTMYGLIPGWIRRYRQVKKTDEFGVSLLDESGKPIVVREETKSRVKVDNILSREKDLALALKTPSIRIETPVMGESLVGIEVPNSKLSAVSLRSVIESKEFAGLRSKAQLPVALGKGSGGETMVIDLAKMPHLLIAGATGSGKSVCLNTIVSCLITEKAPDQLRLLLIDPKRVELTPYNGIPHLITPVVVDTENVVGLLKGAINEMLDRYRRMEEVGVRNIQAYNDKMSEKMPLLVVVVDELADLMMSAAFDVEQSLCRLAQLGRATGIHLIVATQRPSVDVVTGLIKANFPSRISFAVTSQVDSRTILDTAGADRLLGRGDMLYMPIDASRPIRVQGVFITDREIEGLVKFWQKSPIGPLSNINLRNAVHNKSSVDDGKATVARDELFEKAIELANTHKKLSTSLLQRRLRIGYPRAGRLMDRLEEEGIVSPGDGSKSRDVIMS